LEGPLSSDLPGRRPQPAPVGVVELGAVALLHLRIGIEDAEAFLQPFDDDDVRHVGDTAQLAARRPAAIVLVGHRLVAVEIGFDILLVFDQEGAVGLRMPPYPPRRAATGKQPAAHPTSPSGLRRTCPAPLLRPPGFEGLVRPWPAKPLAKQARHARARAAALHPPDARPWPR